MEKGKTKKIVLFLVIILIVTVGGFFGYFLLTGKENPLQTLVESMREEKKIKDNYNGIYTHYDELNGTQFIFRGCSISKIGNHILIIDDDFYLFRSSCMGTYLKDEGKIADLDIQEENKSYYINYNEKKYSKDNITNKIILNNDIEKNLRTIDLSSYQLIFKETEFAGNYYDIKNAKISGISSDMQINFVKDSSNKFTLSIKDSKNERTYYTYYISDFNNLPDLYTFGISVAAVEKGQFNNKFNYSFKVINPNGTIYNLADKFPIKIDQVELSMSNSIFIKFDPAKRYFKMLVGFDDKMCTDDYNENEKNDITYYEFKISYNYSTNSFDNPMYVKTGRKSEGCKYVNSIIGG